MWFDRDDNFAAVRSGYFFSVVVACVVFTVSIMTLVLNSIMIVGTGTVVRFSIAIMIVRNRC